MGLFSFLGGAVKTAVKTAASLTGLNAGGTPTASTVDNKSSADAAAFAKKKLQLAKAKAATKVAKAKAKTAVATTKAKMLKTVLMVGGGVVLLVMVFFMAKGGKR